MLVLSLSFFVGIPRTKNCSFYLPIKPKYRHAEREDFFLSLWIMRRGFWVFAPKTSEFEVKAAENDQIPSCRFHKTLLRPVGVCAL